MRTKSRVEAVFVFVSAVFGLVGFGLFGYSLLSFLCSAGVVFVLLWTVNYKKGNHHNRSLSPARPEQEMVHSVFTYILYTVAVWTNCESMGLFCFSFLFFWLPFVPSGHQPMLLAYPSLCIHHIDIQFSLHSFLLGHTVCPMLGMDELPLHVLT